jgi:DnaJ-class molecular chaperone
VRDLAEEKRESAQNIENGFGHPTYQSEELTQQADDLETWADDIEQAEVPALVDYPCDSCQGEGESDCDACNGEGTITDQTDEDRPCGDCEGTGQQLCEDCDADHLDPDAWREAIDSEVTVMDEVPL